MTTLALGTYSNVVDMAAAIVSVCVVYLLRQVVALRDRVTRLEAIVEIELGDAPADRNV